MGVILASSILIFLTALVLFRFNYLKSKKLKKLINIRNHIARDLHDDVGATLSSISFYAQAVKQRIENQKTEEALQILNQMGESARHTVESMSDIVWVVNPANDSFDNLFVKIEDYAKELCASNNILIDFRNTAKQIHKIDLLKRRDIYLICKEAINNIIKYAHAKKMELSIHNASGVLFITIKDDGKGFDQGSAKSGNGLLNMKVRTADIGGTIRIHSELNKGTEITLQLPLSLLMN